LKAIHEQLYCCIIQERAYCIFTPEQATLVRFIFLVRIIPPLKLNSEITNHTLEIRCCNIKHYEAKVKLIMHYNRISTVSCFRQDVWPH